MQKLIKKTRCFIFLSNYIRIIITIATFLTAATTFSQWLDAYIPDFKVNDDNLNSYQVNSQIGIDTAGNFTIVWYDARNFPGQQYPSNIYCQRYNKDGLALGSNFIIGQDSVSAPRITVLSDGRFIVLWLKVFTLTIDYYEFYFQRFGKNGQFLGSPVRVIDTAFIASSVGTAGYCISSDSLGRFIVCWSKGNTAFDSPNVYFQRFDSAGVKTGGIDSVMDGNSIAEFPDIAMNKDGSFVIAWQDDRFAPQTGFDIFIQKYNSNGNSIGNNLKVNNDNTPLQYRGGQKLATNGRGKTVVVWNDPRNCSLGELFYQMYDSNLIPIGINRKANNSNCIVGTGVVQTNMRNDGKFFIYWSDWNLSGREQSYGRRFDSVGNVIGNQYMIPANSPSGTNQRADNVKLLGDRIYATWTDDRNGGTNNYDIYCNVRGFQNPDTVIGIVNNSEIIKDYRLFPAYPNPFNPVTQIKFEIPKQSYVTLKVFDLLGKEVTKLYNGSISAGSHSVIFEGTNISSGIYFYSIEVRSNNASAITYSDVKKMVLIK